MAAALGGVHDKAGAILEQVGPWDKRELPAAHLSCTSSWEWSRMA